MSEAENIVPVTQPFAERVYETFQNIDVSPFVKSKNGKDYLPWAPAWDFVLQTFPESTYKFKKPHMFAWGGGEQWVTVTIIDGDDVYKREWWLPYLDYANKPVSEPTSFQINNTRMRVLVKCLAMCGLGTELYTGEDVPDKQHDAQYQGGKSAAHPDLRDYPKTGAMADALASATFDPEEAYKKAKMVLDLRDFGDYAGIKTLTDMWGPDLKIGVWGRLASSARSDIKANTDKADE